MLDAYIIDRIRKERERDSRQRNSQVPLHIEDGRDPRDPMPDAGKSRRDEETDERGSVKIDFHL